MEYDRIAGLVDKLLHTADPENGFIDLKKGFLIKPDCENFAEKLYSTIRSQYGKKASTMLRGSGKGETRTLGVGHKTLDWIGFDGRRDINDLEKFKNDGLSVIRQRGHNPVFLSLGAIRWEIVDGGSIKKILSPLIIFPIRLVRPGDEASPVYVEFVPDRVFVNPAFLKKLQSAAESVYDGFPSPECPDDIEIDNFEISLYFNEVANFIAALDKGENRREFAFEPDTVAIGRYNNPDICMYHDIRRNLERILNHPIEEAAYVRRSRPYLPERTEKPSFVPKILPYDAHQEQIIDRAAEGVSMVVQGPPGTGKSQTVANIVAAFIAEGKKVLFVSQKIAALTEVHNKLPETLRPYLLRIDRESEKIVLNPNEVQASLKEAFTAATKADGKLADALKARETAYREFRSAREALERYRAEMFGGQTPLGRGLYKVIDEFCRSRTEAIEFDEPSRFFGVTEAEYAAMSDDAEKLASCLRRLTSDYAYPLDRNPWYGFKGDPEDAYPELSKAAAMPLPESPQLRGVPCFILERLRGLDQSLTALPAEKLESAAKLSEEIADGLRQNPGLLRLLDSVPPEAEEIKLECADPIIRGLSLEECLYAANERELLQAASKASSVLAFLRAFRKTSAAAEEYKSRAVLLYDEKLFAATPFSDFGEDFTALDEALGKYAGSDADKPSALDFKAKSAFKKALAASKTRYTDFKEVCLTVHSAALFFSAIGMLKDLLGKMRFVLKRDIDGRFIDLLSRLDGGENADAFGSRLKTLSDFLPALEKAIAAFKKRPADKISVGDLCDAAQAGTLRKRLTRKRSELSGILSGLPALSDEAAWREFADGALALKELKKFRSPEELPQTVAAVKACEIGDINRMLRLFYQKHPKNSVFASDRFTIEDLEILKLLAPDLNHIDDNREIRRILETRRSIDVGAFFDAYLASGRPLAEYVEAFSHSFLAGYIAGWRKRNAHREAEFTGKHIEAIKAKLFDSDAELMRANAEIAALSTAEAVRAAKEQMGFLQSRPTAATSRRLMSERAEAVLKLKPCLAMSPSVVSLLLGDERYMDFDLVIVDEASQIPPESLISILYRGRQCLIFGDENQMPIIYHFVGSEAEPEGEYVKLDSVLTLTGHNNSFPVMSLCSHYRSVTEELIAYSQKLYYPEMITFPSTDPHGEDVGVFDVYLPHGYSASASGASNPVEAQRVLEILTEHFRRHYSDGKLSQSVGVVTFGEAQARAIRELIERSEIAAAVNAIAGGPLGERHFFVRAVEKVQGHEMDKIVLSFTYGRLEDGRVIGSFGTLNRGELGQKVFNVAVTRAKRSLIVVHSITWQEITGDNVRYLRDYLRMAEQFAKGKKYKFVSEKNAGAYVESVVRAIRDCGVSPERIVTGYGVTQGSVRIPVAVLSPDLETAQLGVMCETRAAGDYTDFAVRYPKTLEQRGWKLFTTYAYDWARNNEAERGRLAQAIKKYVTTA